ncbi:hypothetical protein G7072_17035 [Nocardioides sp. HDW12B]|uniref:hypothetical protein n=1 Tax=Nocardioides sp. HDW12B TaxID=2714939 RepID=UPI001409A8B7|nr:hypothetical protein [Nocardioides sp. HDW12B]QIK67821.1 hypothetical protein G7072_17035 [Nocardioides sp. HDW12B]
MTTLTVPARFNGPPTSGNGGWTAGAVAEAAGTLGAVPPLTVSLKAPPPLDVALTLDPDDDGTGWTLTGPLGDDGATAVVATVRPDAVLVGDDADPGPAVGVEVAREAASGYAGLRSHPFPTCVVCGPEREPGDGLRIFPGRLPDGPDGLDERVAATWTPDPSVADSDGQVGTAVTWAALDCVGGWSSDLEHRPLVLAAMSAGLEPRQSPPQAGATYVVVGRLVRTEGRKTWTTTGMYDDAGRLVARAQQLWVAIRS